MYNFKTKLTLFSVKDTFLVFWGGGGGGGGVLTKIILK